MANKKNYLGGKSYQEKMTHVDQRYIIALKENRFELIDEIYKKYSEMIQKMVTSNNGSIADAKDLMQDAMITLHEYAHDDFRLTCSFKSFLYTICKRRWINMLKSKGYNVNVQIASISEHQFAQESIENMMFVEEQDAKMDFCTQKFNMLGPSCKEILKMSWLKNESGKYYSWIEVSEHLGISYNYVRKKANECKKRLVELAKKDPNYRHYKY